MDNLPSWSDYCNQHSLKFRSAAQAGTDAARRALPRAVLRELKSSTDASVRVVSSGGLLNEPTLRAAVNGTE